MIGSKEEEEKKDEVLQQINDALERENWGGNCETFIINVIFNGKCKINSIFCRNKFDND
jgi:hypothetical protein